MRRDWLLESGAELAPEDLVITRPQPVAQVVPPELAAKQVTPPTVPARTRANPFLAPDLSKANQHDYVGRLSNWELLGPLYRAFEQGSGGEAATMKLPPKPRIDRISPPGSQLMVHQSRFLQAVQQGHRTFLLADEPGLGKTAQSVLAASVANAYPMLAVVPNVVKINWAREVERWTPQRRVTIIHGDGEDVDAFADVFVVNYAILDRHFGWLSNFGFRSMVVDEAHFIKNLQSQRSQQVLALGDRLRETTPGGDPLLLALTGTPLINDVKDFDAIWRFLGWIKDGKPVADIVRRLDETGYTDGPGVLPGGQAGRHRHGHRPSAQGRRRERPAGQADRRHHGRAGRRGWALDRARRAGPGRAARSPLPGAARRGTWARGRWGARRALMRRVAMAELKAASGEGTG